MAFNSAKFMVKQGKTALMICDIQEKLANTTYEFEKLVKNTMRLIKLCKFMEVPVIVTEQQPKDVGPTFPEIDISGAEGPFVKSQFSMCIPEVNEVLSKICSGGPPEAVLLVGLDAHVCVECTAIDLMKKGIQVHAVADCISSRVREDRNLALERMRDMGCVIASTENVIFQLIVDSKHPQFRNVLEASKERMAEFE